MNKTWRNEWRIYSGMRTAGRWAIWACVMLVGCNVLATVVQRITEG